VYIHRNTPNAPINIPSFRFAELQNITDGIRKIEQAMSIDDCFEKNRKVLWMLTSPMKEMKMIKREWIW
jgi:hypothetical protein